MGLRSILTTFFQPRATQTKFPDSNEIQESLNREQRALAEEIERLFHVFDERLTSLAERTRELSPQEMQLEISWIRSQQNHLRQSLRRLETAAKTTAELERELDAWQAVCENGPLYTDHPAVRAELIRSELWTRRAGCDSFISEARAPSPSPKNFMKEREEHIESIPEASEMPPALEDALEQERDSENLLTAIREASREVERWHGLPLEEHGVDALEQVRHLRELHAFLKRLDREHGITRDRFPLAPHTREVRE